MNLDTGVITMSGAVVVVAVLWVVALWVVAELVAAALTATCVLVMVFGNGMGWWWGTTTAQLFDLVASDANADPRTFASLVRAAGVSRWLSWPLTAVAAANHTLGRIYPLRLRLRRDRLLSHVGDRWVPWSITDDLSINLRHVLDAWRTRPSLLPTAASTADARIVPINSEHWAVIFGGFRPGGPHLN